MKVHAGVALGLLMGVSLIAMQPSAKPKGYWEWAREKIGWLGTAAKQIFYGKQEQPASNVAQAIQAAKEGDLTVLQAIKASNAKALFTRDAKGFTPLDYYMQSKSAPVQTEIIQLLVPDTGSEIVIEKQEAANRQNLYENTLNNFFYHTIRNALIGLKNDRTISDKITSALFVFREKEKSDSQKIPLNITTYIPATDPSLRGIYIPLIFEAVKEGSSTSAPFRALELYFGEVKSTELNSLVKVTLNQREYVLQSCSLAQYSVLLLIDNSFNQTAELVIRRLALEQREKVRETLLITFPFLKDIREREGNRERIARILEIYLPEDPSYSKPLLPASQPIKVETEKIQPPETSDDKKRIDNLKRNIQIYLEKVKKGERKFDDIKYEYEALLSHAQALSFSDEQITRDLNELKRHIALLFQKELRDKVGKLQTDCTSLTLPREVSELSATKTTIADARKDLQQFLDQANTFFDIEQLSLISSMNDSAQQQLYRCWNDLERRINDKLKEEQDKEDKKESDEKTKPVSPPKDAVIPVESSSAGELSLKEDSALSDEGKEGSEENKDDQVKTEEALSAIELEPVQELPPASSPLAPPAPLSASESESPTPPIIKAVGPRVVLIPSEEKLISDDLAPLYPQREVVKVGEMVVDRGPMDAYYTNPTTFEKVIIVSPDNKRCPSFISQEISEGSLKIRNLIQLKALNQHSSGKSAAACAALALHNSLIVSEYVRGVNDNLKRLMSEALMIQFLEKFKVDWPNVEQLQTMLAERVSDASLRRDFSVWGTILCLNDKFKILFSCRDGANFEELRKQFLAGDFFHTFIIGTEDMSQDNKGRGHYYSLSVVKQGAQVQYIIIDSDPHNYYLYPASYERRLLEFFIARLEQGEADFEKIVGTIPLSFDKDSRKGKSPPSAPSAGSSASSPSSSSSSSSGSGLPSGTSSQGKPSEKPSEKVAPTTWTNTLKELLGF